MESQTAQRTVQLNCSVTLNFSTPGAAPETYAITEREHAPDQGRLSKGSIWGQLLLGKCVGDTVTLPAGECNEVNATITEISDS